MDDFKGTPQSHGEDVAVLKKAVLQGSSSGPETRSKVRVPELKGFNINKNVKELENFLWDIEQFFKAAHILDGEKVSITSMYLTGDAKLWWRTRMEDDAKSGMPQITTWETLKKKLKDQLFFHQHCETGVHDLPTAMAITDCLEDYKMGSAISTMQRPKGKTSGEDHKGCAADHPDGRILHLQWPSSSHRLPQREKLSTLVTTGDKGDSNSETPPKVNLLQLLNVKALVDSGATHNFVATRETTRLGLKLEEDTSRIKAVNRKTQKIQGVAKNVPMQIGDRKGTCSLLCVPLDDFDLILDVDFLLRAKVALIPHLGGLMVLEEKQPCFVKALKTKDGGKGQPEMLSAIQLKKRLKKGQETYVAALIEIKEGQSVEVLDLVIKILKKFRDVMPAELPKELPPRRPIDHKIELLPGTKALTQAPYRDASCRVVGVTPQQGDHQDKYPIPLAAELFDRLSKASYFTKLDLRSGYWQVRITVGDEGKATCVTRYGSYEFLVMPFGLTNAPAIFFNLMNDRLRENKLYVKLEKCEFAKKEITFLGHKISAGLIRMDKGKVQAIMEWSVPTKVMELRSFLGLANYYRRFIKGYSNRVSPLNDLLKKDNPWEWSMQCQMAFEGLKEAVSTEPVLRFPDLDLPFEV
ncbi:Retrovirus-related Pol polyprotein from transposon 297 [Vitis vinifera]|uniref:Retrovirus-related Pol polyprotein from transposon 297 n=1 Tax=Vitis vinifera TaxID=29760 RepID=A0A438J729_VITVI|nr:Retrovirus-related Pol polyprotein from transposon 297 [Vitis vinifera]